MSYLLETGHRVLYAPTELSRQPGVRVLPFMAFMAFMAFNSKLSQSHINRFALKKLGQLGMATSLQLVDAGRWGAYLYAPGSYELCERDHPKTPGEPRKHPSCQKEA